MAMEESSLSSVNVTQNPFDTESLDSLHLPQCSPSVFAIKQKATPASTKKTPKFRWSIDQMAILHPAEIEELPYQQEDSTLDQETEEKIQAAIDKFFSQQQVVPSPWSDGPKLLKRIPFSPKPPLVGGSDNSKETSQPKPKTVNACQQLGELINWPIKIINQQRLYSVAATCQTMLTLPMDFDLEALLGSEHFKYKDEKPECEILSTSSLRRKLFQCDVTPPISPVKGAPIDSSRESMPFIISSPPISPIRAVEDVKSVEPDSSIVINTPSSTKSQFSSSPIAGKATPSYFSRMSGLSSDLTTEMESPSMSPIRKSGLLITPLSSTTSDAKSYTKSDCKGAFLPDDSSICMSIMESPIRPTGISGKRSNFTCPSPGPRQDKTCEDSLDTWSKDLNEHPSQKLTSTLKLREPMDSLGLSFEPRMCSSRLMVTQENRVHASRVVTSESSLTTSEVKQDNSGFGGFRAELDSNLRCCNSSVDSSRKECAGVQPRAPSGLPFGPRLKAVAMEVMGANSDSGINTYSTSSLEPTDMEIIEER